MWAALVDSVHRDLMGVRATKEFVDWLDYKASKETVLKVYKASRVCKDL